MCDKNTNAPNDKIGFKDLYAELWRCRDFEITHFWQRSVFLATFLLAIAAAYGKVIFEISSKDDNCCFLLFDFLCDRIRLSRNKETVSFVNMHVLACFLSYLGICFSILWQMMVKGSKYFYESYERGIDFLLEPQFKFVWDEKLNNYVDENHYLPLHGWLNGPYEENPSIFSSRAYRYSVSSVNSMIGVIGIICWLVLSFMHQMVILRFRYTFSIGAVVALSLALTFIIFSVEYALLNLFCVSRGNNDK